MMRDENAENPQARSGAAALIEGLQALDVTRIYGVPGEETTALMDTIAASDLDFVLCRHEQAAAFQASVHGRLTGTPGVCLSTLGPGATNLVTGVADAQLDHVPLIAITGQGARNRLGRVSHQMIDLEALFRPITKLSRTLLDADSIPGAVAEAMRLALADKPGAVHLCLPEDVAAEHTTAQIVYPPAEPTQLPAPEAVMETAVRIEAAKRPVILAGAGVIRAGAAQNLALLAEATHIPLATTFMAKGILPADHDQTLFTLGQPENDYIDLALGAADLVIAVGFDPVEYSAAAFTDDGNIPVLSVDTRPSEADAGWQLAGHLLGSLPETLDLLRSALSTKGPWPASATLVGMQSAMRKELARQVSAPDATRFAPQDICAAISRKLRPEDTVLSGVGLHKLWVARHLQAASPGQIIIPNGLAGMGLALPGALAAASLKDEGRVLAICGDGDLLMNVQEMETAARLHARLTVVVWEDGGYGLIEEHQGADSDVRLSFANPGWDKLAAAFGWSYAPVHTLADLSEVLDAGLAAEGPTLITVQVDYGVAGGLPKARAVPENSSDPLEH